MKSIIIAIDGHSSCGKSTMAKNLAKKIGYTYVDTGAMYRAVTLYSIQQGLFASDTIDEEGLKAHINNIVISFDKDENDCQYTMLNGKNVEEQIRSMEVSNKVSPIATLGFVREAMVAQQRVMGRNGAIVMDGRDIGTVVYPNAELKIFVTATAEIRAMRRYKELKAKGANPSYDDILNNVKERDYIDSHRAISPLKQATDAILLDNSNMTIEEQDRWLMEHFIRKTNV